MDISFILGQTKQTLNFEKCILSPHVLLQSHKCVRIIHHFATEYICLANAMNIKSLKCTG